MPPVGFEPTISVGQRPQSYALDRAATGTGYKNVWKVKSYTILHQWRTEGGGGLGDSTPPPPKKKIPKAL